MKCKASFLYALRILNPPVGKNTSGRRSLNGAIFCIALSLIPLVLVQTVADGMIEGISARLVGLSSSHIQAIQYAGGESSNKDSQRLQLEIIRDRFITTKHVKDAFIEISGPALASAKEGRTGAAIRAVDERIFTDSEAFFNYLEVKEGTASFPKTNSAILGEKIAKILAVKPGDAIRLITGRTLPSGRVIPKVDMYTVSGIVSSGYEELDALWVFIPLEKGLSFFDPSSSKTSIGIEVDNAFSDDFIKTAYAIRLKTPAGWIVSRWDQLNATQFENFSSTQILLLIIMLLIVLVASVNISSALVMVVMERKQEIAILKSIGASNAGITFSFFICGSVCGFAGVLIGVPLGILCSLRVNEILLFFETIVNAVGNLLYTIGGGSGYIPVQLLNPEFYLEKIPVMIPIKELIIISIGTIVLSMLVSLIPALKAGSEKPLSIFRKV